MTENWLDYDQKIFTTTNLIFWIWPKFMTPTNINFTPKKCDGAVGLDRSPSPNMLACTGWDTCPALLHSSKRKKTSGTEVRRTPDVMLRFVGFIRFVGFKFGQIQKIRFVVVMIRSYLFGHLESIKWITLLPTSSTNLYQDGFIVVYNFYFEKSIFAVRGRGWR